MVLMLILKKIFSLIIWNYFAFEVDTCLKMQVQLLYSIPNADNGEMQVRVAIIWFLNKMSSLSNDERSCRARARQDAQSSQLPLGCHSLEPQYRAAPWALVTSPQTPQFIFVQKNSKLTQTHTQYLKSLRTRALQEIYLQSAVFTKVTKALHTCVNAVEYNHGNSALTIESPRQAKPQLRSRAKPQQCAYNAFLALKADIILIRSFTVYIVVYLSKCKWKHIRMSKTVLTIEQC